MYFRRRPHDQTKKRLQRGDQFVDEQSGLARMHARNRMDREECGRFRLVVIQSRLELACLDVISDLPPRLLGQTEPSQCSGHRQFGVHRGKQARYPQIACCLAPPNAPFGMKVQTRAEKRDRQPTQSRRLVIAVRMSRSNRRYLRCGRKIPKFLPNGAVPLTLVCDSINLASRHRAGVPLRTSSCISPEFRPWRSPLFPV